MSEVTIDTGALATVYVSAPEQLLRDAAGDPLLRYLDGRRLQLICSRSGERADAERLIASCGGLLAMTPDPSGRHETTERDLRIAESLGLPSVSMVAGEEPVRLESFLDHLRHVQPAPQDFAFLAVRIHGDFALIRAAIGDAVEHTLGIPCVWYDDPRVITPEYGMRERTQLMIRHCALFIADVTYGPGNPDYDSPNTAHEIGMALAYERPVVLSCQEPRRDLYFSAGDLHTLFWEDEHELNREIADCFRSRYSRLGRRLLNLELAPNPTGFSGGFPRYRFEMDRAGQYVSPPSRGATARRSRLTPDAETCLLAVRRQPAAWKAVWHPLGFMDIELFANQAEFLRLHIWSEVAGSYRSSGLSIHKHDWSMSSQVLCGVVENRIYDVLTDRPPTHRIYRIEYSGEVNQLQATDRVVRCELRESEKVQAGATYTLAPDTFHDIAPPLIHSTTATLVKGIRHPSVRNEVLGPLDAHELYETERVLCDPASVREAIDLVIAARRSLTS